jgi:hypothetical protein
LQKTDPKLWEALILISKQADLVKETLNPTISTSIATPGVTTSDAYLPPTNFRAASTGRTLRFTWDAATSGFLYEIRRGTSWDSADFITRTPNLQADIDPVLYGTYDYLIKTVTLGGVYSSLATSLEFTLGAIPTINITAQVIDNNVLFYWTAPTSTFEIDYYTLYRDGVEIGRSRGTFSAIFEQSPGTFAYSIIATDIAGNDSVESFVTGIISQPPDYELFDNFMSSLNGTLTNLLLEASPKLLCCVNLTETWATHFSVPSWTSIQDQIDAGFPYFEQPAKTTGQYDEKIDFGTILTDTLITVLYDTNVLDGSTTITVKMSVSDDDMSYSSYVAGSSQFYASFRYVKIRLEFVGADTTALLELYNLVVNLDVKHGNDGGQIDALAADTGGTVTSFNRAFKDITSLTATPWDPTSLKAVVDFVDVPDPTDFKVLVFDDTGTRVDATVYWKARGVI